jgi:hypothetical protein
MPQRQTNKPEGKKKDPVAPSRSKKGKVHNRGRNPARTFFTNHTAGACVDRSYDGRTVTHNRDAGYGVAERDRPFAIFRREWVEVDGVFQWRVLAIKHGGAATPTEQRVFSVDAYGRRNFDMAPKAKKEEAVQK